MAAEAIPRSRNTVQKVQKAEELMTDVIPAAPGWYVTLINTRTENGKKVRFHDERPIIAWKVVDADHGSLLPILADPRPGAPQPTLIPDMGQGGRRVIYRKY